MTFTLGQKTAETIINYTKAQSSINQPTEATLGLELADLGLWHAIEIKK